MGVRQVGIHISGYMYLPDHDTKIISMSTHHQLHIYMCVCMCVHAHVCVCVYVNDTNMVHIIFNNFLDFLQILNCKQHIHLIHSLEL